MKKTITKIWGIGIVVTLLASLLIAAAPVSAADNEWTATSPPSTSSGTNFADIAIYKAGESIFALLDGEKKVYKSTNKGSSWSSKSTPSAAGAPKRIAVSPSDSNIQAFISTDSPTKVYMSKDGGSNWYEVTPTSSPTITTAYDVEISPAISGVTYLTVCGTDSAAAANVWLLDLSAPVVTTTWATLKGKPGLGATGYTSRAIHTIVYSPNYLSDRVMVAVTFNSSASDNVVMMEVYNSAGTGGWNSKGNFPTSYPVALTTSTSATGITRASLALDPNYRGSDDIMRNVFVGLTLAGDTTNGGLWRVEDYTKTKLNTTSAYAQIYSVDYNGTNLVAGLYNSATVLRSSTPMTTGLLTPNVSLKGPGGTGSTIVAYLGDTVVAATSGDESSFARSTNGAQTFNGISQVDTKITNISDYAMNSDASVRYIITDDGTNDSDNFTDLSVWRGELSGMTTTWERILSVQGTVVYSSYKPYILDMAPGDTGVVYVAEKGGTMIYYTKDAGTRWSTRTCGVTVQDIAVESASTVYALDSGGKFTKTDNDGYIWSTPSSTAIGGNSLKLVSTGVLIAGCSGSVRVTSNGGTSWASGTMPSGASGPMVAAADTNYAANKTIYAASSTAGQKVYKGVVGTSITWTSLEGSVAGQGHYAIAQRGGIVYTVSTSGSASQLNQYVAETWASASSSTVLASGCAGPNPAWMTYSTTGASRLYTTTADSLRYITDVIGATVPTMLTPTAAYSSPVGNEIIFSISAITDVTDYRIQIAYDSAFTQMVKDNITMTSALLNTTVGPNSPDATKIIWMPGTTYYWRLRATAPLGTAWTAARSFTIQPGAALVPNIGSPENGATITSTKPAFSWSPVSGATQYEFQLSTSPTFSATLVSATTATTGIQTITALIEGNTYFWRVRATLPVTADWSSVANFTVAVPAPPVTTPPVQTVTVPVTLSIPAATTTVTTITIPPATVQTVTVSIPAPVTTTITMPAPTTTTITMTQPQPTTYTLTQAAPPAPDEIATSYIWAIIIIGAVLVIAVIVLIVRTRRTV